MFTFFFAVRKLVLRSFDGRTKHENKFATSVKKILVINQLLSVCLDLESRCLKKHFEIMCRKVEKKFLPKFILQLESLMTSFAELEGFKK